MLALDHAYTRPVPYLTRTMALVFPTNPEHAPHLDTLELPKVNFSAMPTLEPAYGHRLHVCDITSDVESRYTLD